MYERFTDRARKTMELAQADARRRGHLYVGTEHILLGLISEGSGVAAIALQDLGIEKDRVLLEVEKIICPGPDRVSAKRLPQTPRAKHVVALALEEARTFRLPHVGTEHLFIGLLLENEGVAAQVLTNLGVSLNGARREIAKVQERLIESPDFQNRISQFTREGRSGPQRIGEWLRRLFRV